MANLKDEFQTLALDLITKDFLDLAEEATYQSLSPVQGDYNVVTDQYSTAPVTASVHVIRNTKRTRAKDGLTPLTAKEEWVMIPGLELGTIEPKPHADTIVRGAVTWTILEIDLDPASALYQCMVRRP